MACIALLPVCGAKRAGARDITCEPSWRQPAALKPPATRWRAERSEYQRVAANSAARGRACDAGEDAAGGRICPASAQGTSACRATQRRARHRARTFLSMAHTPTTMGVVRGGGRRWPRPLRRERGGIVPRRRLCVRRRNARARYTRPAMGSGGGPAWGRRRDRLEGDDATAACLHPRTQRHTPRLGARPGTQHYGKEEGEVSGCQAHIPIGPPGGGSACLKATRSPPIRRRCSHGGLGTCSACALRAGGAAQQRSAPVALPRDRRR